jgi:Fic family protein
MHYQFETIHPFLDGNGRIGRLLIGLMLVSERRLSKPLLYLSGYLETHRQEYYDALQGVRERGDIDSYLRFFLTAIRSQAGDAVDRARRLIDLREEYADRCRLDRSLVGALLPLIFRSPFITVQQVQADLGVTHQGARNLLQRAAGRYSWLTPVGVVGRGGRALWMATEVLRVIDSPLSYGTESRDMKAVP